MKTKVLALFLLASSSMFAGWRVGFGVGVGPAYVPPPRVYVARPPVYVAPPPYLYSAPYSYYSPYPYVDTYVAPVPYGRGYWHPDYYRDRWHDSHYRYDRSYGHWRH
jgi:hypothetical protein